MGNATLTRRKSTLTEQSVKKMRTLRDQLMADYGSGEVMFNLADYGLDCLEFDREGVTHRVDFDKATAVKRTGHGVFVFYAQGRSPRLPDTAFAARTRFLVYSNNSLGYQACKLGAAVREFGGTEG